MKITEAKMSDIHDQKEYHYIFACGSKFHPFCAPLLTTIIEPLNINCPVETLEKEVMRNSGFSGLYHELEFFGQCPACA